MREYATPAGPGGPRTGNLTDAVARRAEESPEAVVLSRRTPGGAAWEDVTAAQLRAEVVAVAKGLVAAGVEPGDRVAIVSRTRWEWTVLDLAAWWAGAVTVPVYETSSPDQLAWVLGDAGAVVAVVEGAVHLDRLASVRDRLPDLREVLALDVADGTGDGTGGALAALRRRGAEVADEVLEARRTAVEADDLATLVYTSGTTGRPKGCELTHGCFLTEVAGAVEALPELFDDDASTLVFLPLAHVFARVVQVGCLQQGVRLGHSGDAARLLDDLATFRPTFVLAVPRVFEKVFTTASQRAAADGRGRVFDRAVEVAIAWSRALDKGRVPVRLRAQHALLDRFVYDRVREALGGECRIAVSGGAPLGDRLGHFFRGIGTTVLEGYGLTETTAAVTVNQPDAVRIGSVGRPLPGVAVRVDDDGELLVRGGMVMRGYHGDEAATAEVLTPDGWLRTGDVGEVDDEGFVRITGRKKEILVTAGGKNVAPSVLEDRLRAHPLVGQCLVVGDGRPYIAALVTIDPDAWPVWAERHGKKGSVADHVDDPDLRAAVEEAVEEANRTVSKAEAVRRFTVLPEEWTEEGGQLTPSLKLKRGVVARQFRREVESLYES